MRPSGFRHMCRKQGVGTCADPRSRTCADPRSRTCAAPRPAHARAGHRVSCFIIGAVPDLRTPVIAAGSFGAGPQPTIEHGGLVLRPWRRDDAAMLARAYADPGIRRWHVRSMDEDEALRWMQERCERWRREAGGDWVVLESGAQVGRVSLHGLDLRDGCAKAGYWVLPEARGRGLATRALLALTGWAFDELGLHRIELEHSTANTISCRVALRAGFRAEGTRRGAVLHDDGWHDMHMHARLRGEKP